MVDLLENIYGSTVQHGPHNNRVYVLRLAADRTGVLLPQLEQLAKTNGYGKIFAKIPSTSRQQFLSAGYIKEADIPLFYSGKTACCFVSKFFFDRQRTDEDFTNLLRIIKHGKTEIKGNAGSIPQFPVELCTTADAEELSIFYRNLFESYPFPVFDAVYLHQTMRQNVQYYCIREEKKIVAAAAIESNEADKYAEMTDFATIPSWRGKGLAACLLRHMDQVACSSGILTAFTIARATSYGMNRVFQNCGYTYSGLLINNTQIGGSIQSMTVWYRHYV
ncbi:putative beta-lysine N-acetyltransferase [Desulfopila sp. IMCC35008]|uniref:putative beta-lysine N-acetyltransferase n=1 Tax=Desulfopila sp. IMCC35008 TaxID=2653858 RepID=UPI0013D886D2|nr:putative beta-lysine N-acetyltransferase [Desulfopila sp. IMCC35008]